MYIHIGGEYSVSDRLIVGIFDFDETTHAGSETIHFLQKAQEQDRIEHVSSELPRSFVVTVERVYLSPISAATLRRRLRSTWSPDENLATNH
ncbi:MAG: DUF370 domain-containing protein [Eubacteriales bacterium]|nr:DUF370 domain-containing protein [Eubacteriales bacterium]